MNQSITKGFWNDRKTWQKASANTLICLVCCAIGDFIMISYLRAFYPLSPMIVQMSLSIIAGLVSSIAIQIVIFVWRDQFSWNSAIKVALSMSMISMIAMQLVMITTDMAIMGASSYRDAVYWVAFFGGMLFAFAASVPYNYYQLKKYDKNCH